MSGSLWDELLEMHLSLGLPCSCGCGSPLVNPEMHHGIVSKARARGIKKQGCIDHRYNCFLVNHACHQRTPGPRHFWKVACDRYGRENVQAWYEGLQRDVFRSRLECLD